MCLLAAAGSPALRAQPPQADDERIAELLERLRLPELQMLHLEQQLPRLQPERRAEVGRQLADLYAERLLTADADAQAVLKAKIDKLIAAVPQADTPGLGVMLLQAGFQEAEKQATAWLARRDETARQAAAAQLAELVPELRKRQAELAAQVKQLNNRLDSDDLSDTQVERLEEEVERTSVLWMRAMFLTGWAGYYDGVVNANEGSLTTARILFRKLLSLDDPGAEMTAEWTGIEAPARARSMIGLAVTEAAKGDLEAAEECFRLLQREPTPPEIRDQVGPWQIRGLLNAGNRDAALETGRELVADFSSESTAGKAQLSAALIEAGLARQQDGSHDQELARVGIEGLARIGEFKLLRQLLEEHNGDIENPDGFYLAWVHGRLKMEQANAAKSKADYEEAIEALRGAIASEEADRAGPASLAQCRAELAWCLFHVGQYREAASQYQQSSQLLASLGQAEPAAKSAWMAFVALQQGSRSVPSLASDAEAAAQSLKADFPDSSYARRAAYELTKMNAADDPDGLRALEQVAADDPNYLDARFDLCRVRHGRWLNARGTPDEPSEAAGAVRVCEEYLQLPAARDPARRLRAAMLGCEVAAEGRPPQNAALQRLLAAAAGQVDQVRDNELLASYHYYALRSELAAGDNEAAVRHALQLEKNPAGARYEQTALVILAKAADAAVAADGESPSPEKLREAAAVYQRLSDRLGDQAETLASNRNAQVALFKLSDYQLRLGETARAADGFQRLLEVSPKNRQFLRGAAQALFDSGKHAESLGHWRTLLRAASDGEPSWYEAKYHQLACLIALKDDQADAVRKQFELLHPDPPEPWKSRFAKLK